MDIQTTLNERRNTHGDFTLNSATSQRIKAIMRDGENWNLLIPYQREALEMVAHKIGRILSGNPDEVDHWRDIAGYATLVEQRLVEAKRVNNIEKLNKLEMPVFKPTYPTFVDPADEDTFGPIYKGPTCDELQKRAFENSPAIKEYL